MTRQAEHDQRVRDAGGKRITVTLQPATVAALRELRARGAVSDTAAVNDAVLELWQALKHVDVNHYDKRPKHMTSVERASLNLEPDKSALSVEGITGDDLIGFVKHGERWYRSSLW